jgi:hypothetical protein
MKKTLRDRIAALAAMNVPALREEYRKVFGKEPFRVQQRFLPLGIHGRSMRARQSVRRSRSLSWPAAWRGTRRGRTAASTPPAGDIRASGLRGLRWHGETQPLHDAGRHDVRLRL